ncbi:uncharacterized protein [Miscanthus floridulus]|uniref:uncharacterized protein n=1 Tax=Miscanthus floridulus TaxID=154761 RepID=UPI00345943F0
MRVGFDRAKKATTQLLKLEYANLKFKDGESVEDFSLHLQSLISKPRSHDVTIDKEEAVSKYLHSMPMNYQNHTRTFHKASLEKKKKKVDPNTYQRYGKMGHRAKECPNHKQEKKTEAHLAQVDEDDEATLLMMTLCALHDVEAKEKGEVMAVERHDKALKAVNLDEPCTQVHLRHVGSEQEQRWYLDSNASNHMTGSKEAFSKLDSNVTSTVKFSDSSRVLDERGNEILIKDGILRIRDQEQRLLAKVKRSQNRLYLLDLKVE